MSTARCAFSLPFTIILSRMRLKTMNLMKSVVSWSSIMRIASNAYCPPGLQPVNFMTSESSSTPLVSS
ncbi:hypothetical protein P8452_24560 [Trifolium repens]|nr:hypothetical protein P8452_24560 [Trifolium repens]